MDDGKSRMWHILAQHADELLTMWLEEQMLSGVLRRDRVTEIQVRQECTELLDLFVAAVRDSGTEDVQTPSWQPVRDLLGSISRSRVQQGQSPSDVATFIFSLKRPLARVLGRELAMDPDLLDQLWHASVLVDKLGLYAFEVYVSVREGVIARQQEEMLELSTPVVKLWDGVLALPMIGTLDSARTQVVMESLLQRIVETGADIAIIDITGVPTVDTLVAQHLMKTVAAARLMGAECIISGIRPAIAQTIVHLGVDLGAVITKATLADAFKVALLRTRYKIVRIAEAAQPGAGPL